MLNGKELLFGQTVAFLCLFEVVFGLAELLHSEGKSTPVNANWLLALELFVDLDGLLWVDMLRAKQLSGLVGSDWENG